MKTCLSAPYNCVVCPPSSRGPASVYRGSGRSSLVLAVGWFACTDTCHTSKSDRVGQIHEHKGESLWQCIDLRNSSNSASARRPRPSSEIRETHRSEYEVSRKRLGIREERVWLVEANRMLPIARWYYVGFLREGILLV